jgi:hypothetical protein
MKTNFRIKNDYCKLNLGFKKGSKPIQGLINNTVNLFQDDTNLF